MTRKEDSFLTKQLRTPKLIRPNLPTLIEASPEFNQKKLSSVSPIPDLPASVLVPPDVGLQLQSWYRQQQKCNDSQDQSFYDYPITDGDFFNMPALETVRSPSRASNCSVKFYSDPETKQHSYKHQTKVIKNKRRSKEKEIFEKKKVAKDIKMKETYQTQGEMFADEKIGTMQRIKTNKATTESIPQDVDCWNCKKCTLQNPLDQEVCLACGGSKLNSVLQIDNLPDQIEEVEYVNPNLLPDGRWICDICTLQNESLNSHCDACNSKNPYMDNKPIETLPEKKNKLKDILHKTVRYFGIFCLASVLLYLALNVVISIGNGVISLGNIISTFHLTNVSNVTNHLNLSERQTANNFDGTDTPYFVSLQFWGLHPILLGILTPIFMLVIFRGYN